ncbi:hypothetical protein MTO96_040986 [Rhipicephalus appendiculatus]
MNIAVLALLFVLLDPAMSEEEQDCNLKGQKKIDWNKLARKRWYAALDDFKYSKYKMCNERLIYPKEGIVVEIINQRTCIHVRKGRTFMSSNHVSVYLGGKSWNNTSKAGWLEYDRIAFPRYHPSVNEYQAVVYYYQILDTDHDTWAIEHTCGYNGSKFVLLLSKKMEDVPNEVMWQVRRSVRKAGVKYSESWYASGCLSGKGSEDYIDNLSLVRGALLNKGQRFSGSVKCETLSIRESTGENDGTELETESTRLEQGKRETSSPGLRSLRAVDSPSVSNTL